MKRGEERGREEKKSARREERKENLPLLLLRTRTCQRARGRGDVARETVEVGGEKEEKREREGERERENEEREEGGPREMKRERMKKDVDKTWQPGGGWNNKTVHLSGNADVVPQSGPKMKVHAIK